MWTCPKCNEQLEDQFDSCWKCAGQTLETGVTSTFLPTRRDYYFAGVACFLIAPLVFCLHAFCVMGTRREKSSPLYNGIELFLEPTFWIFVLIPAVISYIVIYPNLSSKTSRLITYICLCLAWLALLLLM